LIRASERVRQLESKWGSGEHKNNRCGEKEAKTGKRKSKNEGKKAKLSLKKVDVKRETGSIRTIEYGSRRGKERGQASG